MSSHEPTSMPWVMCAINKYADSALIVVLLNLVGYCLLWAPNPHWGASILPAPPLRMAAYVVSAVASLHLFPSLKQCSTGGRWAAVLSFLIYNTHFWNYIYNFGRW